jgi:uncharacterized protein with WD repeat
VWNAPSGQEKYAFNDLHRMISSVAWSPLGLCIASAGLDSDAFQLHDTANGALVHEYHIDSNYLYAVAWSPNGARIVTGSGGGTGDAVQVWDLFTNSRRATYHGHRGPIYAVAWSPDGKLVASAGYDKTVHLWNPSTGKHVLVYQKHNDVVNTIGWSPTGKYLASGSNDQTVHIWAASTGRTILIYKKHRGVVRSVFWSPDREKVAIPARIRPCWYGKRYKRNGYEGFCLCIFYHTKLFPQRVLPGMRR